MIPLLRLHLRTRRVFLAAWLIPLVAMIAISAPAYQATYPDRGDLALLAEGMRLNLGLRAMYGIIPEPFTFGSFVQWELAMWLLILGSVMTVLLAVRLTRAEEEDGNLELLRSSGVPAHRPTLAAALMVMLASVLLGAGAAVALIVCGLFVEDMPAWGGVITGAAIAVGVAACGAVALVAAQATATARAARMSGLAFAGAAFALRAFADVRDIAWLRWLSPLGWRDVVAPYSQDRVWPLAVMAVIVVAVSALAVAVAAGRDLGSTWPRRRGLRGVAGRAGRAGNAARGLGPLALRLRLERPTLIAWGLTVVLVTTFYMSMTGEMGALLDSSPGTADLVRQLTEGSSMEAVFVHMMATFIGILLGAAVIQVALAAHRDEKAGLLGLELAAGVRRPRPFLVAWAVAAGLALIVTAVSTPIAAVAAERSSGIDGIGGDAAWAIAGQAPAALAMIGIAVFLAAAAPKLTWLAWVVLAASGFLTYLGGLFEFIPQWVLDSSLLAHPPHNPDGTFSWTGAVVLLAIGVAGPLLGAALSGKRDTLA